MLIVCYVTLSFNLLFNYSHRINQKIVLIDLEYFLIAEAASYCNAPYSAILYTELWALEAQNNGEKRMTLSQISADRKVQLLMQEVYQSVNKLRTKHMNKVMQFFRFMLILDVERVWKCFLIHFLIHICIINLQIMWSEDFVN